MSPLERMEAIKKEAWLRWLVTVPDSEEEKFWDGYLAGFDGVDITKRRDSSMFDSGLREGMWVHQRLSTDYLDTGATDV